MNQNQDISKAKLIKKNTGWGVGIWVLYGGFVVFMLGIVLFVSLQQFDLVRDDYYQQDLKYQEHIEKARRVESLKDKPTISYDRSNQVILFGFSDGVVVGDVTGKVELFRPSSSSLDRRLPLELDDRNRMVIPADELASGVWRVRIDFEIDSLEFYLEEMIVVEGS